MGLVALGGLGDVVRIPHAADGVTDARADAAYGVGGSWCEGDRFGSEGGSMEHERRRGHVSE